MDDEQEARVVGHMTICVKHWSMLRDEINEVGLGDWIAPDGETARMQLAQQMQVGEMTPVNYDPLMHAFMMITEQALTIAGFAVFRMDCLICGFNERRNEDGTCPCGAEDCDAQTPGSIPNFEGWLTGPESAARASLQYMMDKGWIS